MTIALGVVIGFLNTSYAVNKSDGLVNIQVGIIQEELLQISVAVNFSISQNQSDRGKSNLYAQYRNDGEVLRY
jgi:hypothetical protein